RRIDELDRKVAVTGEDLHSVDAGFADELSGTTVASDDLFNDRSRQRLRPPMEAFLRSVAGRYRLGCHPVFPVHDFTAGVEQLSNDSAPVAVHRIRYGSVPVRGFRVRRHEYVTGIAGGFVHPGYLQNDQSRPAGCA